MKEFILIVILILVAAFVVVPLMGNNAPSLDEAERTIREVTQQAQAVYATQQAQAEGTAAVIAAQANGTAQAAFQLAAEATRQAEATAAGLSMVATSGMMTAQADQRTATAVMSNNLATATAVAQATQDRVLVELHCHCCQQPFFANHRKPCGCGEGGIRDLKYCGNCLKCKQHCICKKPRLVSEYPTAFAVHRSVA